jgi:serine/threonine-protein kinase HipA
MIQMNKFKHLNISTTQGHAGALSRESQLVFNYQTEQNECEIALTMPLRAQSYASSILPGVLRQHLPEGHLYHWIKQHFGKTMPMNDMNILAITGREMIGRVRCAPPELNTLKNTGESLNDMLTWRGTEDLFDYLAEKYAMESGISGVQPKVLVKEKTDNKISNDVIEKSAIKSRDFIIKSNGDDYPGLAQNEYICMSIAKAAGLNVPDFWLSDNRKLFIIDRFDYHDGSYRGFEDMTALMGRQNDEKYQGSYEQIAKAVQLFTSPSYTQESLRLLFQSIVLSCLLRNGDAHLKNFGILYTHPHSNDSRLAPVYDIVNTTMYIPQDSMALKLNKTKAWPTRKTLCDFAKTHCLIDHPQDIIDHISECAMAYQCDQSDALVLEKVKGEIEKGCFSLKG